MLRHVLPVSFIICILLPGCTTLSMTSSPGIAVGCRIVQAAPGSVTCADAEGKTFTWTTDQSIKITGACRPCPDGSCPSCPVVP